LRTLGLQVVQDVRELGHLGVFQLELVGQKAQRPPDAEAPEVLFVIVTGKRLFAVTSAPSSAVTLTGSVPVVLGVHPLAATTTVSMGVLPPCHHSRIHFCLFLLAEAFAPGGFAPPAHPADAKAARGRYASRTVNLKTTSRMSMGAGELEWIIPRVS
jgi:hypothetical protein